MRFIGATALFLILISAGCHRIEPPESEDYLVRSGKTSMTRHDFSRAFEVFKTAYDYESLAEPERRREARVQFLKEISERMLILERGRELGLDVSPSELERTVRRMTRQYPEGALEEILMESAISLSVWKEEVRIRLLMDKVVRTDLSEGIEVSPEEIEAHLAAQEKAGASDQKKAPEPDHKKETRKTDKKTAPKPVPAPEAAGKQITPEEKRELAAEGVRRMKSEAAYRQWLMGLQERHPLEVNETEWKKILDS